MKPPICAYCGKRFTISDGGGLVTFADYEPLPEGMVGHPKGRVWFCKRHFNSAQSLNKKSSHEALKTLSFKYRFTHWLKRIFTR